MRTDDSNSARSANSSHLWKLAEYTSLAASAFGVVVSVASQQMAYAAAPLSLSLFLNLVNRQRFEQQTAQRISGAISQVDQHLSHLDQTLAQLQQQVTIDLGQQVAQLDTQIRAIEQHRPDSEVTLAQFNPLQDRVIELTEQLSIEVEAIQQQMQTQAPAPSLEAFKSLEEAVEQRRQRLTDVDQQLSQLAQQFSATQQLTTQLAQQLNQLTQSIDTQRESIAQRQSEPEVALTQFQQLQDQVTALTNQLSTEVEAIRQQMQTQAPAPSLETSRTIEESVEQLRHRLSDVDQQLNQLAQQFPHAQQLTTQLAQQIAQLTQPLETIRQRQMNLEAIAMQFEQQLTQLSQNLATEIQAIYQQIQIQAAAPRSDDLQQIQPAIAQLQTRIAALETLSQLDRLPELQSSTIPPVEPLSESATILPTVLPEVPSPPVQTPVPHGVAEVDADREILALNLGIDFGTSFTKICVRDIARAVTEVIPFSDELPLLQEALLPSKIGILSDGTLIAGLTASEWAEDEFQVETCIEFIKMRLADLDIPQTIAGWQWEHLPELDDPETVENLCAYYLSRVITRAQAWIRLHKPELITHQKIEWSANVGVPVAYYDSAAIKRFQTVLSLAWLLSSESETEPMTLQQLGEQTKKLRLAISEDTDCNAVPELAAGAWSFLSSHAVDEGLYTFLDVGDGTLDGCLFRYWNHAGEKKVDFYFSKVDPLGVRVLSKLMASELNISEDDVRYTICENSTRYSEKFQSSHTRRQVQQWVSSVVGQGWAEYRQHEFQLSQNDLQQSLPIFIGGGGSQTTFYTQTILSTDQDFKQQQAGIPAYTHRPLPTPQDLEMNGLKQQEFYRFAVAYGLSIPVGEQPAVRLPSTMASIRSAPQKPAPDLEPPRYDDRQQSISL